MPEESIWVSGVDVSRRQRGKWWKWTHRACPRIASRAASHDVGDSGRVGQPGDMHPRVKFRRHRACLLRSPDPPEPVPGVIPVRVAERPPQAAQIRQHLPAIVELSNQRDIRLPLHQPALLAKVCKLVEFTGPAPAGRARHLPETHDVEPGVSDPVADQLHPDILEVYALGQRHGPQLLVDVCRDILQVFRGHPRVGDGRKVVARAKRRHGIP